VKKSFSLSVLSLLTLYGKIESRSLSLEN